MTSEPPLPRGPASWLVGILLVIPVLGVLVLGLGSRTPDLTGDVAFYAEVADRILAGQLPYLDFEFEYPPLSVLPMLAPRALALSATPDQSAYELAFLAWNASLVGFLSVALAGFALRCGRPVTEVLLVFVAVVLASGPMIAWRYDLLPAALLLAGISLLAAGRPALAGLATGLGIGVKLFPGVLLPLGVIWLVAAGRRLQAVEFAAATVLISIAPLAALAFVDPEAAFSFLGFQAARGFQIESVTSGLLELGSTLGLTPVGIEFAFKTYQISSPLTPVLLPLQLAMTVAAQLALAAGLWFHLRRGTHHPVTCLTAYAMAAVVTFMITNKVLSPQHLVWLVPLVPLSGGPVAAGLVVAAAVIGSLLFPGLYPQLIGLDQGVVLLLNLRNLLLVMVLAWVVLRHGQGRESAAPEPARRSVAGTP